ncbi:MAG: 16S rRNA (cytidine(1402)-2'-O)-methyltransferase [Ruminococcus sp.]|nr:16S rRNA (cytidine(1402)-2'-O)-methyltransferase [Candidatus Apopatosoma intestinale]
MNPIESPEKNKVEKGTLYLVGTPIGNLSDLSDRAKKVLSEVDFVAAEDTRNSGKLLAAFGIKKPMVSYFEHNKREHGEQIAARLLAGESCALVTDAGMPAISDPGEDIVRLCAERGIPVSVIPGPCAAVSALALSGLPTSRFVFEGFLSTASAERKASLAMLKNETRTAILYEAPHKLLATLRDLYEALGDRKISLCRELTKLNEEVVRTTLSEAVTRYENGDVRGEFVLILAGASEEECRKSAFWADWDVPAHVAYYVDTGMTKNEAVKAVARDRGTAKSEIYNQVMKK